jgi:hypothetical protein
MMIALVNREKSVFNELGTFSPHVKLQVCFKSETPLGCAVGVHGKEGFLSHFYACGKYCRAIRRHVWTYNL